MAQELLILDLRSQLEELKRTSPAITTLADGKPNRIVSVDAIGVRVETEESKRKGTDPQLVAAWMINAAWDHLRSNGSLTNRYLLASDGLNAKRSSAVCALLARLPGVSIASSRPIELRYEPPG